MMSRWTENRSEKSCRRQGEEDEMKKMYKVKGTGGNGWSVGAGQKKMCRKQSRRHSLFSCHSAASKPGTRHLTMEGNENGKACDNAMKGV